jgi:hypothetical protein
MLGIHRATFWRNFVRTGRVRFITGTRRIADNEVERILGDAAPAEPQPHQRAKVGRRMIRTALEKRLKRKAVAV